MREEIEKTKFYNDKNEYSKFIGGLTQLKRKQEKFEDKKEERGEERTKMSLKKESVADSYDVDDLISKYCG